ALPSSSLGARATSPLFSARAISPDIVCFSSPKYSASSVIRGRLSHRMPSTRIRESDRSCSAPILLMMAMVTKEVVIKVSMSASWGEGCLLIGWPVLADRDLQLDMVRNAYQ